MIETDTITYTPPDTSAQTAMPEWNWSEFCSTKPTKLEEARPAVIHNINKLFDYAPYNESQITASRIVINALKGAFQAILLNCPPSSNRTTALQHLIDARMRANAAITHGGRF
jgi:hypothetical protein